MKMIQALMSMCESLTDEIKKSYEESITIDEAEKLAGKFLHAQLAISSALVKKDLDARIRKTGVKAIKAAIYLSEVQKVDKKPSDSMLEAYVNSNELVQKEQDSFDKAEIERDELQNHFNVFKEAHIFYRGISKGRFE